MTVRTTTRTGDEQNEAARTTHPAVEPAGHGVTDEENSHLDHERSRYVRQRSLRLLVSLLRPVRRRFAYAIVLVVVGQAARVAGPAIVAVAIDRGLPAAMSGDWGPLWLSGGAYLTAALTAGLCTAGYIRAAAEVAQAALLDLRQRVFRHTQLLSLEFHETYTSGRIISRQTSDLEAMRELLDNGVTMLAQGMLFMSFTGVSLVLLDWRSGLVVAVALIPVTMLVRWFQKRSRIAYRETRVASARLIVDFVETMTGIRAVQAFRREAKNNRRHAGLAEDYRDKNYRAMELQGILDPGLVLIGNLTLVAALAFGAFRVLDGSLTVGILVATLLYVRRFFQPIQMMAMFYNAFQSAAAALEKISGLLEEVPTVQEPDRPVSLDHARGHVRFDDVTFGYGTGPVVLPRFDLDIAPGTTVALVGSTGAGKSTLAKLLTRFYDATSGHVSLDGVDLRDLSNPDLRRSVIMVTQEAYLFSGTVRDNVALARPDATDEQVRAAAHAVGAHEFILELPDGYDTDVNKRGGRVSAGQRQLISFARAFLADPAVLVLDEATSSLDIPGERQVQEGLQSLLHDRTAIIIAHRLSTVAIADRVLVMADGRIVEDGPTAELIAGNGEFAALHAAWRDSLV